MKSLSVSLLALVLAPIIASAQSASPSLSTCSDQIGRYVTVQLGDIVCDCHTDFNPPNQDRTENSRLKFVYENGCVLADAVYTPKRICEIHYMFTPSAPQPEPSPTGTPPNWETECSGHCIGKDMDSACEKARELAVYKTNAPANCARGCKQSNITYQEIRVTKPNWADNMGGITRPYCRVQATRKCVTK